ncbi:MAG: aminotransferase class IV [Alistipes sp.]|nr:aminotransferase class IV [Alistipes sp.]
MTELYLYQTIHLCDGRPRLVEAHAARLAEAARTLFGCRYAPDIGALEERLAALAQAERYPQAVSGFVRIELTADGTERLRPGGLSYYHGYALRSLRPDACAVCYELPFADLPTSAREAANELARRQAELSGAETAIRCDPDGTCRTADDAPLFAVRGRTLFTAPAAPSVERDLALRAIRSAELELHEEPLAREMLAHMDELFYVDHRGVTALARCNGTPYMALIAEKVASAMERLF